MNAERLLHERSAPLPSSKSSVSEAASAEPAVVARSETKSIVANPNASTPGGAIFAASAKMGMYPNIKPPDATTLLIARGASGAADGSREPSQASTTSRRARPQTAFTAAPTAKDVLSVKENANPGARAYSAPAARRYAAVARMPPSMDSSSMTLYPQAGSVNCAYANVVNVTSDVGGSRYANRNSAHVATRGVKHGANGASAARVAEPKKRETFSVRFCRRREENREAARRSLSLMSAVMSWCASSSSKPPMSSMSSSPMSRFGHTASASRRASYAPSRAQKSLVSRRRRLRDAFGSGTAQAAAAAARAKTPASAMTILASVSASRGMESAVAVKLPAERTSMPALCTRMAFFESPPLICASAPSAPVSQIAKTTTEETPAAYSAGIESTRA